MYGIFINDDCFPFTREILAGRKTIETRNKNMLKDLAGKRVALISTRRGKRPAIVGYAMIDRHPIYLHAESLDFFRDLTRIPAGSKYDPKPGAGKWCYNLFRVESCDQYTLPENAIRHGRSWCEFNLDGSTGSVLS